MNRRSFLQRFGIGVSAALALAALPVEAIQALTTEQAAKRLACEHLRRIYNAWCSAHRGEQPCVLYVSRGLYEAYEGEITASERYVRSSGDLQGSRGLMFKGAWVVDDMRQSGWDVRVEALPDRAAFVRSFEACTHG